MKQISRLLSVLMVLSIALAACAPSATPTQPPAAQPTSAPAAQPTQAPQAQPTQPPAPTESPAKPTQPPAQPTAAPAVTRPIVIVASDQPGSADPAENWTFGGAAYLPHVYDSLFRYVGDASPKLTTLLASEIPTVDNGGISKDGLTYTVKLKPGAKFHDGSPVNADAVVYSYDRIKALNLGANGITADWITKTEKVDDLTVKFTLKQPFSDFLNSMGSVWGNYIVNPAVAKANEKDNDWGHAYLLDHDAGSGPYSLASFDHANNQITLERFKDYWGGWSNPSPIDKAYIRWLPEATMARSMLEKGDADIVVNLSSEDFAALEKASGFDSQKHPSIMQYYLSLNGSSEALKNAKVRQALQYSFNTDQVISDIFNGNMLKMDAAVGPGYPDVYPATPQYPYDLEKAKSLLAEAGFEKGLELTANLMHFWPNDTAVLEYWQADLAKIGVTLKIQETDQGTWSKAWFDNCTAGTAPNIGQISTMGVGGDYPSAWEVIGQVYPTPRLGGGKCSAVYINDPVVNDTYNKIAETTDPTQRQSLFQTLYNQIAEDAGAIWIGQAVDLVTLRDVVEGYQYYFSMGGNYVPLMDMSLTK
jgi:peptide/nickel transport system substrate-binding protein